MPSLYFTQFIYAFTIFNSILLCLHYTLLSSSTLPLSFTQFFYAFTFLYSILLRFSILHSIHLHFHYPSLNSSMLYYLSLNSYMLSLSFTQFVYAFTILYSILLNSILHFHYPFYKSCFINPAPLSLGSIPLHYLYPLLNSSQLPLSYFLNPLEFLQILYIVQFFFIWLILKGSMT